MSEANRDAVVRCLKEFWAYYGESERPRGFRIVWIEALKGEDAGRVCGALQTCMRESNEMPPLARVLALVEKASRPERRQQHEQRGYDIVQPEEQDQVDRLIAAAEKLERLGQSGAKAPEAPGGIGSR